MSQDPLTREEVEEHLGVREDPDKGPPYKVAGDGKPPYAPKVQDAANVLVGAGVDRNRAVHLLEAIGFRRILHRCRKRRELARERYRRIQELEG